MSSWQKKTFYETIKIAIANCLTLKGMFPIMMPDMNPSQLRRLISFFLLVFFSSSVLVVCTEEYSYSADCSYCSDETITNSSPNEPQDNHNECLCPCHVSFIEPSFHSLSSHLNVQSSFIKLSTLTIKDISINIFRPPKTVL